MLDLDEFKKPEKPYSLFFGEIAEAAMDGDPEMTVGIAIRMNSPSASEWVGANCSGEKPFFLTTSGDGKIADLLRGAIKNCLEGRFVVSGERYAINAAHYDLCECGGARIGDIWVGIYTESGEAAKAQDRVEKYLHNPGLLSESIRID